MGSHRGHKSSQEVQGNGVLLSGAQAAQGHRAQPGAQELPISSTAVLGGCRSPGTGSRERWGLLLGDLPLPLAVVLGCLLWVALQGQGGPRGPRVISVQPQATWGSVPCRLFVTKTAIMQGAPRLLVPAKRLQRRCLSASASLGRGQEVSWIFNNPILILGNSLGIL